MPTSKSTGAEPAPGPAAVAMDAELAARLVAALEMIGTAIKRDEVNDDRVLALMASLAERPGDGREPARNADPIRARAARDYDVLRGLLGRAGAPRPLNMRRSPNSQNQNIEEIIFLDRLPSSATTVVVESPGDGASGPVTERFDDVTGGTKPTLELKLIRPTMPISRVEVLDVDDILVAFGPSLTPPVAVGSSFPSIFTAV